jgi:poly(hydroxyalkanoate) depolymerase family esterase
MNMMRTINVERFTSKLEVFLSRGALIALISLYILPLSAHAFFSDFNISTKPSAPPAPMKKARFTHEGLTRSYSVFTPPSTQSGPRPLVVLLHGCLQDSEEFAAITKMNQLAIRENFFVVYPEQSEDANPLRCWSWFDPDNQSRAEGASERAWLAALVESIAGQPRVDRTRVYIAGLSAGAAMAVNMLSCHPDLFTAGAIHAGVAFGGATNASQSTRVMKHGSPLTAQASAEKALQCVDAKIGPPLPIFVLQGEKDKVVERDNAMQVLHHFEALNDLRDDGKPNGSFMWKLSAVKRKKKKSRRKASYPLLMENFRSRADVPARLLWIKKLGHAWSGGAKGHDFSDPNGPSASDLMWDFFAEIER